VQRAVRFLTRAGVRSVVDLGAGSVCADLRADPTDALRRKAERRLGGPVEARLRCDVAHYPLGRGFVVVLLGQPADGLDAALDAHRPTYREVVRPSGDTDLVRVCVPGAALGDPLALVADLRNDGFDVVGAFEVGGCRRP
jgi:hypothetical protein